MAVLDLALIEKAINFLEGKVRKTPLEYSSPLSELLKVPVYLKLESLQLTGSFKIRGALFYLSTLSKEEKEKGVAAASAGNHGLGIAYAAKELGIACTVYVPKNVDSAKYEKMIKLGATVKKSESTGYDDTLEWAESEAAKSKTPIISAYNDETIMAANGGTLGAEILDQLPGVQNVITPVGGGGLSGGLSFYVKAKKPHAKIICAQHTNSPALKLSLEQGKAVTQIPAIETVAGGIEGGLGEKCFEILKSRVDHVALLSEEEIIKGLCWMLENHQYLVEPSSSVAISACLYNKLPALSGPTVIVLTGRNIGYQTLKKLIASK